MKSGDGAQAYAKVHQIRIETAQDLRPAHTPSLRAEFGMIIEKIQCATKEVNLCRKKLSWTWMPIWKVKAILPIRVADSNTVAAVC